MRGVFRGVGETRLTYTSFSGLMAADACMPLLLASKLKVSIMHRSVTRLHKYVKVHTPHSFFKKNLTFKVIKTKIILDD